MSKTLALAFVSFEQPGNGHAGHMLTIVSFKYHISKNEMMHCFPSNRFITTGGHVNFPEMIPLIQTTGLLPLCLSDSLTIAASEAADGREWRCPTERFVLGPLVSRRFVFIIPPGVYSHTWGNRGALKLMMSSSYD